MTHAHRYLLVLLFLSNGAFAGAPEPADACAYTDRGWSAMRGTLVAISKYTGNTEADVQTIARQALAGSPKFTIGDFELHFARGNSGLPKPNDSVCFPKMAMFSAVRNDGADAAYQCEANMDVKGKILSIHCLLAAD